MVFAGRGGTSAATAAVGKSCSDTTSSVVDLGRLTVDMSGGRRQATLAGRLPFDGRVRRHERELKILCGRLRRRCRPQQLRFEESARNARQDDRRESDYGGEDQQARTAEQPGLEKSVAHEKQYVGEGSGGVRHAHDLA